MEQSALMENHPPQLLLIEDEPATRRSLERALRQKGYDVTSIENHPKAEALLNDREMPFAVIISDIDTTPARNDGITFGQHLRETPSIHQDTPIIYHSGGHSHDGISTIENARFLQKPTPIRELIAHVEDIIGHIPPPPNQGRSH